MCSLRQITIRYIMKSKFEVENKNTNALKQNEKLRNIIKSVFKRVKSRPEILYRNIYILEYYNQQILNMKWVWNIPLFFV